MSSVTFFLNDLKEGVSCELEAIVCRKWDVYSHYGKYKGTDYVLSDAKGNVMHCTTRSSVAHLFIGTLKEGCVYTFKDFLVIPNLKEYRVVRSSRYMIELHGRSVVRRRETVPPGFCQYMFNLTDIGDVKFDIHDTALIDVVGYVIDVGTIVPRPVANGQKLKKASQTLEFYLLGARGHKIRVTFWGQLADEFLQRRPPADVAYAVILVGLSVRTYKGTFLSSTSNTLIYDAEGIPQLAEFKKGKMHHEAVEVPPVHVTLLELSQWCKAKKKPTNFHCNLRIAGVDTTAPWYYFACTSGRCMKGVTRRNGGFFCESCDVRIEFPKTRFKIRLNVEDRTHAAALTLFDSTAEAMLSTSVDALLAEHDDDTSGGMPPQVMLNLVNTWHVFEIPSQTYYPHGGEGYTCVGVTPSTEPTSDGNFFEGSTGGSGARKDDPHSNGRKRAGSSSESVVANKFNRVGEEKDDEQTSSKNGSPKSVTAHSNPAHDSPKSGSKHPSPDHDSPKSVSDSRKRKNVIYSDDE